MTSSKPTARSALLLEWYPPSMKCCPSITAGGAPKDAVVAIIASTRLTPLAREVFDLLILALILNAEVFRIQVGHETAAIVGDGNRHNYLVHLHLDRRRLWLRLRFLALLCNREGSQERYANSTAQHLSSILLR